jgi:hypothetical protein
MQKSLDMNRFYDELGERKRLWKVRLQWKHSFEEINGSTDRLENSSAVPELQRPTSSQNMAQSRKLEVGDIVNVELICLGYKDDPTTRRPQPTHGPRYGIIIDHDGEQGPYTIIPICTAAPRTMQTNPINGGGEDAVLTTHPSLRGKLLFPPTASPWAPSEFIR